MANPIIINIERVQAGEIIRVEMDGMLNIKPLDGQVIEVINADNTPNLITIDASQYAKQVSIAFAEWIADNEIVYKYSLIETDWFHDSGEGIGNTGQLFSEFLKTYNP